MKEKIRARVIIVIFTIMALVAVWLIYSMAMKNSEYKEGLERQGKINGAWALNSRTILSIDYGEGSNIFILVKDNQQIKRGTIKKVGENYYLLYDKSTKKLYAKIIPSYKKIYVIKKDLDIFEFDYFCEAIVEPSGM